MRGLRALATMFRLLQAVYTEVLARPESGHADPNQRCVNGEPGWDRTNDHLMILQRLAELPVVRLIVNQDDCILNLWIFCQAGECMLDSFRVTFPPERNSLGKLVAHPVEHCRMVWVCFPQPFDRAQTLTVSPPDSTVLKSQVASSTLSMPWAPNQGPSCSLS
jgi:hypothetical protein